MDIGLIGGGRAAAMLLDYFQGMESANVRILSDLRDDAPGVVRARELRVRTTKDLADVVSLPGLNLVIELTGVPAVQAQVLEARSGENAKWDLITAGGARLMCEMIDTQAQQTAQLAEKLCTKLDGLAGGTGEAVGKISRADRNVQHLLREARMVTINGRIEASRLGQAGAGFAALVERLSKLIADITSASADIGAASEDSENTLAELRATEQELRRELIDSRQAAEAQQKVA